MTPSKIENLLKEKHALLADGATGTNLFKLGLEAGYPPELWNIEHPERITALHQGFVDAGSDIILTNSFGGNAYRLKLHNAEDRVFELNEAAAKIAKKVADNSYRDIIIAGSIGPTGELLEPVGSLSFDDAVKAFEDQAIGLKAGGADVAWIETMSAANEVSAALKGAEKAGLQAVFTMSFDTAGRTMMGVSPQEMIKFANSLSPAPIACGANCGVGASDMLASLLAMQEAQNPPLIVVKANCGIPEFVGGEIQYSGTEEIMARYTQLAIDAGAKIIGGCCGTSYEHIKAMRKAIDEYSPSEKPDIDLITSEIGPLVNSIASELKSDTDTTSKRRRRKRDA